jgi:hypothetical protein
MLSPHTRRGLKTVLPTPNQGRVTSSEEILCVLGNNLTSAVTFDIQGRSPTGLSFVESAQVDVEPGGHISFVASIETETQLTLGFGRFTLSAVGGAPRLVPNLGLLQSAQRLIPNKGLPAWMLTVSMQNAPVHPITELPEFEVFLLGESRVAAFASRWIAAGAKLPEHATLFLLEDAAITPEIDVALAGGRAFQHLIIPEALFLTHSGGISQSEDGSEVVIAGVGAAVTISLAATGLWPHMKLGTTSRRPIRLRHRWHVLYICHRLL